MSYEKKSIKKLMKEIGSNEVYLPAIQRKFVWKPNQIYAFFDSLMREFPIGTFLFWKITGQAVRNYTYYKFIKAFHERDNYLNETAPEPELKEKITGVLDGQQRISSLYVSLQGTYSFKKFRARKSNDDAYPIRSMYINLILEISLNTEESENPIDLTNSEDITDSNETEKNAYEFKFLTNEESKQIDDKHLWYPVKAVMNWESDPPIDDEYDTILRKSKNIKEETIIESNKKSIKRIIRILHQRLVLSDLINFYEIENKDMDEILAIFVRVNKGGTQLSKSDLLFSTIVAHCLQ